MAKQASKSSKVSEGIKGRPFRLNEAREQNAALFNTGANGDLPPFMDNGMLERYGEQFYIQQVRKVDTKNGAKFFLRVRMAEPSTSFSRTADVRGKVKVGTISLGAEGPIGEYRAEVFGRMSKYFGWDDTAIIPADEEPEWPEYGPCILKLFGKTYDIIEAPGADEEEAF